jgi:hypothetical protein
VSRADVGLVVVGLGLGLVGLSVACQPQASGPAAEPTQADPFAVVRATADAAYRAGRTDLDRGQLQQALVELDQAKTNDPDNRPEIQQALDETIRRIQALPPATETAITGGAAAGALVTPPAAAQTQAVRPSAPQGQSSPAPTAAEQAGAPAQSARATPPGGPAGAPPQSGPTTPPVGQPGAAGPTGTPGAAGLVTWRDPQGRFSIGGPTGWETVNAPPVMFGTGVVGFRDPGGQAELDVAVDTTTRAVSPELYAASMELAMQQVPGYALDSVQPGTTAGNPSVRRVFSQTRQDADGRDYTARGFQLAIVRGSTAYIVSAFAPAQRYAEFGSTFERVLDSLAFS